MHANGIYVIENKDIRPVSRRWADCMYVYIIWKYWKVFRHQTGTFISVSILRKKWFNKYIWVYLDWLRPMWSAEWTEVAVVRVDGIAYMVRAIVCTLASSACIAATSPSDLGKGSLASALKRYLYEGDVIRIVSAMCVYTCQKMMLIGISLNSFKFKNKTHFNPLRGITM